jgi:hypothetical protein
VRLIPYAYDRRCIHTTWEIGMVFCCRFAIMILSNRMAIENIKKAAMITKSNLF